MRTQAAFRGVLVAVLALVVLAVPASAQEDYPPGPSTGEASGPETVQPGTSPTFVAQGFQAGSEVTVVLSGVLSATGTTTANAGGVASFQVTVPCAAAAGPATITFQGTGEDGEARTVATDFTVSDDTAVACERAAGLAGTGTQISNLGMLAIAALLVGGGLLAYTRTNRKQRVGS